MFTTRRSAWRRWRALGAMSILVLAGSGCVSAAPAGTPDGSTAPSASAQPSLAVAVPAASPAATPEIHVERTPDPSPSSADAPPPPSSARLRVRDGALGAYDVPEQEFEVSWTESYPPDTEIRVYGVTECLNQTEGEPCLVVNTRLPADLRDLVARGPAGAGSVGWTWPGWENIGGAMAVNPDGEHYYYAFVAAAYNSAGHSKFIILDSSIACPDCTY
jgi:hypothetical protein